MARVIRYLQFPKLNLENQDKTSTYGTHWEEIKNCNEKIKCILIAEDLDSLYYLPLKQPYVLGKKANFPREGHSGSYITHNGYREAFEIQNFLPDNVFIPYKEFIEKTYASTWFKAYIEAIKTEPCLIHSLSDFKFWLSDKEYDERGTLKVKTQVFECHPFKDLYYKNKCFKYAIYKYYAGHDTKCEYLEYNIKSLNTEYDDIDDGTVLPIMRIEKKTKKKKKI